MQKISYIHNYKTACALLLSAAVLSVLPIGFSFQAHACISIGLAGYSFGNCGGIADSLCKVVGWFLYGDFGRAIASFTIIFLGLQAFFGKISWGTTIIFTVGIIAIFGAQEIVEAITGFGGSAC